MHKQFEVWYQLRRPSTGSELTMSYITWPMLHPGTKRDHENAILEAVDQLFPGWVLVGWNAERIE